MKIFISYRRADSAYVTDNVYSYMRGQFGEGNVFLDVNPDSVPFGVDFREHLKQQIAAHDVVLVIIGPQWAQIMQERASWPDDYLRIEIEIALAIGKLVIPVLVMGAIHPDFKVLPSGISELQWRHAAEIRRQPDFDVDCRRLAQGIRDYFERQPVAISNSLESSSVVIYSEEEQKYNISLLTAETAPGIRWIDSHGIPMVYVPAGKFLMGSPIGERRDIERPPHEQIISSGFYIDLTPVTNANYAHFVDAGGYMLERYWTESGWKWLQSSGVKMPKEYTNFDDPQQPRIGVSWFEAWAYSQWRGGRLPTEAEWEWAARGPEHKLYPWGDNFDPTRIIYEKNSLGRTAIVGDGIRQSGASWVGALDMSGNVWEWCSSVNLAYPYRVDDGREDTEDERGWRVLRGGSWYDSRGIARTTYSISNPPVARITGAGFRVVYPRPA
ncbi:MAG: SUMF1/EgtB/PvdO family nonheme iron enzyme [Anaerolineae bacterium]|nr:SUMF1/EgtB/PvdO family nonheme iron enzyme [Anaerolineae bacterium]